MKTLVLYAALVGLPLVGILGVLQVGRGLTAPPSLAGLWDLSLATYPDGCTPPTGALRIEQSGALAQVRLGGGMAWADLDGLTLRTRGPVPARGGACRGWFIDAAGRGDSLVPARMAGRFLPDGCACAPVPFRAEREGAAPEPDADADAAAPDSGATPVETDTLETP